MRQLKRSPQFVSAIFLTVLFSMLLFPSGSLADPLADLKIPGVRIQLHRSEVGSYKLVILPLVKPVPPSKGNEPVRVFQASQTPSQPRRLVVDYFGLYGKGSKNLAITDKRLKAIRIGDHTDRTRIVIDLKGETQLTFQTPTRLGTGDAFRVDFSIVPIAPRKGNAASSPSPSAIPAATLAVLPTPLPSVTPSAIPTARPTASSSPLRSLSPTPTMSSPPAELPDSQPAGVPTTGASPSEKEVALFETPVPSASPAMDVTAFPIARPSDAPPDEKTTPEALKDLPGEAQTLSSTGTDEATQAATAPAETTPVLQDIGFEKLQDSGAPAVYLIVSSLSAYSLEKRREDLYELSIEQARLGAAGLTLPRFSPEGIEGFDLVVAKQEEQRVIVRIFVEDGVRLFPFVADGRLWIKAVQ